MSSWHPGGPCTRARASRDGTLVSRFACYPKANAVEEDELLTKSSNRTAEMEVKIASNSLGPCKTSPWALRPPPNKGTVTSKHILLVIADDRRPDANVEA